MDVEVARLRGVEEAQQIDRVGLEGIGVLDRQPPAVDLESADAPAARQDSRQVEPRPASVLDLKRRAEDPGGRTSVVQGTGGAVRVDIGGRRIIKQKKTLVEHS